MARRFVFVAAAIFANGIRGIAGARREVRVGYWSEDPNPIHAGIARDWFAGEDYDVAFFPLASGRAASAMLDGGDLDVAILGSSPFTTFAARGVPLVSLHLQYEIGESEALAVRPSITSPLDLAGKRIVTPFGSTCHYHLSFVRLLNAELDFSVEDMAAESIPAAWDNGEIDGAFVWNPHLAHAKNGGGRVLYDSSGLGGWGKPTSQILACARPFAEDPATRAIAARLAAVAVLLDDAFLAEGRGWTDAEDDDGYLASVVAASAGAFANDAAGRADVVAAMDLSKRYDAAHVLNCDDACAEKFAAALADSAYFNYVIKGLGALAPSGRHFPPPASATEVLAGDGASAAEAASYELFRGAIETGEAGIAAAGLASSYSLSSLEDEFDGRSRGLAGTAALAESCEGVRVATGAGAIDDGAGARDGYVYGPGRDCVWVVVGAAEASVVEVDFDVFRVWSGDVLEAYEGRLDGDEAVTLLGTYSGYDARVPRIRAVGAVSLRFVTDNRTMSAVNSVRGDGWAAAYDGDAGGCRSGGCGSGGTCGSDGLCVCGFPGASGGDCEAPACGGTVDVDADGGAVIASAVDALEEGARYGNDADCRWLVSSSEPGPETGGGLGRERLAIIRFERIASILRESEEG